MLGCHDCNPVTCCFEPIWVFWVIPCGECWSGMFRNCARRMKPQTWKESAKKKRKCWKPWGRREEDGACLCLWNTPADWCKIFCALSILYVIIALFFLALMFIYLGLAGYSPFILSYPFHAPAVPKVLQPEE